MPEFFVLLLLLIVGGLAWLRLTAYCPEEFWMRMVVYIAISYHLFAFVVNRIRNKTNEQETASI